MTTLLTDEALVAAAIVETPSAIHARHGLLDTALRVPGDSWQIDGLQFGLDLCEVIHQSEADYCADHDLPTPAGCPGYAVFTKPFMLEVAAVRSTLPGDVYDAAARLRVGLSQALEAAVWSNPASGANKDKYSHYLIGNEKASTPPLPANQQIKTVPGTHNNAEDAIGAFEEEFLKAQAGAGVIHMGPGAAANAIARGQIFEDENGILRTVTIGSKVVVGNYEPSGAAKMVGHIGNVYADVTDTSVEKGYDWTKNEIVWRATALGIVAWNTCGWWKATF